MLKLGYHTDTKKYKSHNGEPFGVKSHKITSHLQTSIQSNLRTYVFFYFLTYAHEISKRG